MIEVYGNKAGERVLAPTGGAFIWVPVSEAELDAVRVSMALQRALYKATH